MARKLIVEIVGDSRSLERSFERSSRSAKRFGADIDKASNRSVIGFASITKAGAAFSAGFLGTQGVISALDQSIQAASNLQEQTAKSEQVFGQASGDIKKWAKTTTEGFGIAQDQALEAAGTFGNLLRTVNLAPEAAAQMSKSLVELAGDLASFNNVGTEEALDAIRSGLIGEAEPLRRFGVLLSETRVQQEAMRETGKTNAKALTDQEKALARYNIILQDTAPAQGDAARTSDSFANRMKELNAELRDFKARIGAPMITALTVFIDTINDIPEAVKNVGDFTGLSRTFQQGTQGIRDISDAVTKDIFGIGEALNVFGSDADKAAAASSRVAAGFLTFNRALREHLTLQRQLHGLPAGTPQAGTGGAAAGLVLTAEQRRQFFDAKVARELDRVQDVATSRGRIASLRSIQDELKAKLAITKDATRRLSLEDQILQITRQIRGEQQGIAANAKAATDAARDRAKAAREAATAAAKERAALAATARENKQFRALGLGPGGAELIPNESQLRRRVEAMGRKGGVVTKKIRNLLGDSFKGLSEDVRRTIDDMLDQIDDALKKHTEGGPITAFKKKSANELLAGLGLSADEIRAVRNRLAGVGIGGTSLAPGRGVGAFGVLVNVDLDGEQVTKKVTIRQQKQRARNPAQKRGSGRELVR